MYSSGSGGGGGSGKRRSSSGGGGSSGKKGSSSSSSGGGGSGKKSNSSIIGWIIGYKINFCLLKVARFITCLTFVVNDCFYLSQGSIYDFIFPSVIATH